MSYQSDMKNHVENAGHAAENAATGRTMSRLARFGYAARGVVYVLIGILAVQLAFGQGGEQSDHHGALHALVEQPFGRTLLGIVAVGLLCFALWSLIQAVFDAEHKGTDKEGIISRIAYALTGLAYGALGVGAAQMVLGSSSGSDSSTEKTQTLTAQLMSAPYGVALVVLVGLVALGVGGYFCYRAYSANFSHHLDLSGTSDKTRKLAIGSGRAGYAAHGLDFLFIGFFLIVAALQHNPEQAQGLDGALKTLVQQPFGPVLLVIVALGFVAYGVYSFVEARYRRVNGGRHA